MAIRLRSANESSTTLGQVVVIGKESAGKSRLVSGLTGRTARSANFRGTTVACETYPADDRMFVDTPGILSASDSDATRLALQALDDDSAILLVVQAPRLDADLADLIPVVAGCRGAVVVTFWDKVAPGSAAQAAIARVGGAAGVPFIPVDARRIGEFERSKILRALDEAERFTTAPLRVRAGWRIEPPLSILDRRWSGPPLALAMLIAPAVVAVMFANFFAGLVEPAVADAIAALAIPAGAWRDPLAAVLVGDYGLLTMGPLLLVWAAPTVVLFAFLLALYKTTGLIDRISLALHPLMRPFGIGGRDLTRVIMGFGCNVPAIINTRACAACSRDTTIGAIAFGSACSYQFGATLAVFAAAGRSTLVVPYLVYLAATTLAYTRLTAPAAARSPLNQLLADGRSFLERPCWRDVWRESRATLRQFFVLALPVFFAITLIASLLAWTGTVDRLSKIIEPVMAVFRLPGEAAIPTLLASIRKDGILLFDEPTVIGGLSSLQLLVGVYLAGVLLPCLVTALTIARERSARFAAKLVARQGVAAIGFALLLAWGGSLIGF